ncbi:MAG: fasciclin domain-containing protein [Bacteroidales bacterium]|nr:fasciclin domain-containing protein [Bacteroidales bacterium]MCF8389351.1 fasciclin domain-containing protein [Bacteroidales bacterium]
MQRLNYIYLIIIFGYLFFSGCTKDIEDLEKYNRPNWLEGDLFTQISTDSSLSIFRQCMELTKLDSSVGITGSYTIFAPNNAAFQQYFVKHPEYNYQVQNIPEKELKYLTQMHIVEDAWTINQLQSITITGWIDPKEKNPGRLVYKHKTICKYPNQKYWIKNNNGNITITDSANANSYRIVYPPSPKFVPIFFPGYFAENNLSEDDYEFYFDRPYSNSSIYYAGAQIISSEIFAENGLIYKIDEVVEPILNAHQILEKNDNFKYIRELLWLFPEFEIDEDATRSQPEAVQGLDYEDLYKLSYPDLNTAFSVHNELLYDSEQTTHVINAGFVAPNDVAFEAFLDNVVTNRSGFPHYTGWSAVPRELKRIIVRNHLFFSPIYPSNANGVRSFEQDEIEVGEGLVENKYYSSNSTFLETNEVLVPKAFSSVSGAVYLRPAYSWFMYALEESGMVNRLKDAEIEYSFFAISDQILSEDSSLYFTWTNRDLNTYKLRAFSRSSYVWQDMKGKVLRKRLMNQIGISVPNGSANKEFIENLAGNYIIYSNSTNEVRGGSLSKFGYNGDSTITTKAYPLEEIAYNGITYQVNGWMIPSKTTLLTAMTNSLQKVKRKKFMDLLTKAKLYDPANKTFSFLTDGTNYTIFIPSEQALTDYGADTLSTEDLQQFLKLHFIRGSKIFTDGKMPSGNYSTHRIDESSTNLVINYSSLYIETGADVIRIYDFDSILLGEILENVENTNFMVSIDPDATSDSDYDFYTTTVIHDIDFVIHK